MRWATALMVQAEYVAAVKVAKKGLQAVPEHPQLLKTLATTKEKLAKFEEDNGLKKRKPSGFKLRDDDTEEEKRYKEMLKEIRRQFLEDHQRKEKSDRKRLLTEEGIVLPRANIVATENLSGFQPFGDYFNKQVKRRRKRKRIRAHD